MREKCIECNKTLRNYELGNPRVHRSCWLRLRDKTDRHYDFLFCNDKREMKKTQYIKPDDTTFKKGEPKGVKGDYLPPINEHDENDFTFVLDIKGNLIKIPKTYVIENPQMETLDVTYHLNDEINELIDNFHLSPISSPSSSPPLSPSLVEH